MTHKNIIFNLLLLGALCVIPMAIRAQEVQTNARVLITISPTVVNNTAVASYTPDAALTADDRYHIGPGDVLDIRILDRPQLSREAVRVDGHGAIRMPMIEGEIQATCRTEGELAKEIATRYLKYQKDPQVDVFVKEYNSKPVSVMGAVSKPGQFQLQRRVRLLELLSLAGGTTERAGERILITRSTEAFSCRAAPDESPTKLVSYNMKEMIKGAEKSNPYLHPGDIITIQEAEQVYIVGNVFRPINIPLKEKLSVSRAIAMAGGTLPDSKSDRVRIVRQVPDSDTRMEIYVDLKAIDKRRAEDVALQANDIVDVPTSTGKRVLHTLLNTVAPTALQFPLRIVH